MTALNGFGTRKSDTLAGQKYAAQQSAATDLAYSILAALEDHQAAFEAADRTNWGYVEELGHLRSLLQEAHNFLTNQE